MLICAPLCCAVPLQPSPPAKSSSTASSAFDLSDCLDIDVTSAGSANWRSEYTAHFVNHHSHIAGGRRQAHWSRVATQRIARLMEAERTERERKGQTMPVGWPSYAVKYTHKVSSEKGSGRAMVSVLREMRRRQDLFVPVDATKRPVMVNTAAQQADVEEVESRVTEC